MVRSWKSHSAIATVSSSLGPLLPLWQSAPSSSGTCAKAVMHGVRPWLSGVVLSHETVCDPPPPPPPAVPPPESRLTSTMTRTPMATTTASPTTTSHGLLLDPLDCDIGGGGGNGGRPGGDA